MKKVVQIFAWLNTAILFFILLNVFYSPMLLGVVTNIGGIIILVMPVILGFILSSIYLIKQKDGQLSKSSRLLLTTPFINLALIIFILLSTR